MGRGYPLDRGREEEGDTTWTGGEGGDGKRIPLGQGEGGEGKRGIPLGQGDRVGMGRGYPLDRGEGGEGRGDTPWAGGRVGRERGGCPLDVLFSINYQNLYLVKLW